MFPYNIFVGNFSVWHLVKKRMPNFLNFLFSCVQLKMTSSIKSFSGKKKDLLHCPYYIHPRHFRFQDQYNFPNILSAMIRTEFALHSLIWNNDNNWNYTQNAWYCKLASKQITISQRNHLLSNLYDYQNIIQENLETKLCNFQKTTEEKQRNS